MWLRNQIKRDFLFNSKYSKYAPSPIMKACAGMQVKYHAFLHSALGRDKRLGSCPSSYNDCHHWTEKGVSTRQGVKVLQNKNNYSVSICWRNITYWYYTVHCRIPSMGRLAVRSGSGHGPLTVRSGLGHGPVTVTVRSRSGHGQGKYICVARF
jgi:hypothetical protein